MTRKQAEIDILMSDTIDLKPKLIRRDKEELFILIKGTINWEDTTIRNIYEPNSSTHTFIKTYYWTSRHRWKQFSNYRITVGFWTLISPTGHVDRIIRTKWHHTLNEANIYL